MIRIGGVGIDVSHPKAFSQELENYCMDMRYAWVFDDGFRSEKELQWFAERFRLDGIAASVDEVADKTDIGFVQSCNWEKHLDQAMPFITRGKPVFIDKPIVGSVKDIARLRELVRNGAKIYGSSSVRYSKEIRDFLAIDPAERGEILSIYGTTGTDEFNYAVHIVEAISALAQSRPAGARYTGEARRGGQRCQSFVIDFENGIQGIYTSCLDVWQPFAMVVVTTKNVYSFTIDVGQIYVSMLREIYRELTFGKSRLTDIETLIQCTEIMLCARKSRDEKNGAKVVPAELNEEDKFDGYAFERDYALTANRHVYED